jgi:ankyrin repeat protein
MMEGGDLHAAARKGDTVSIKSILDCGDLTKSKSLVNATDKHRRTPLHLASFFGHPDAVKCLIEFKADVHVGAVDGFTALHFASQNGHTDVCKQLIAAKANVDRATQRGSRTSLHLAAIKGHEETIKYLIQRRANLEKKNSDAKTPIELIQDPDMRERISVFVEKFEETKKRKSSAVNDEESTAKTRRIDDAVVTIIDSDANEASG